MDSQPQHGARRAARKRFVDGVLLFDKPAGVSSNGALQRVRRLYQAERAGHTGTLDPFATGLLPIAFGEATKFSTGLLEADKTYLATIRLGVRTSTGDPEGSVLEQRPVQVDQAGIENALARFVGRIEQIPPMHSALKHEGRPLYDYARKGEQIDRKPRAITIHSIELVEWLGPTVTARVRCSKGTYIRVLAEDIGAVLGCGAHLSALRRLAVGEFDIGAAHDFEKLEGLESAVRDACLLPVDALITGLPRVDLDEQASARLLEGRTVRAGHQLESGLAGTTLRAYAANGAFLGLVLHAGAGEVRPQRLMKAPLAVRIDDPTRGG